jgi:hypothetical protein
MGRDSHDAVLERLEVMRQLRELFENYKRIQRDTPSKQGIAKRHKLEAIENSVNALGGFLLLKDVDQETAEWIRDCNERAVARKSAAAVASHAEDLTEEERSDLPMSV